MKTFQHNILQNFFIAKLNSLVSSEIKLFLHIGIFYILVYSILYDGKREIKINYIKQESKILLFINFNVASHRKRKSQWSDTDTISVNPKQVERASRVYSQRILDPSNNVVVRSSMTKRTPFTKCE